MVAGQAVAVEVGVLVRLEGVAVGVVAVVVEEEDAVVVVAAAADV